MHFIASILMDPELGRTVGKKSSENSIIYYNGSYLGNHITALSPASVEDKIHAMCESIILSDMVVVSTKRIDKYLAEALLACSITDKEIVITNDNDISDLISGTSLSGIKAVEPDSLPYIITSSQRMNKGTETRIDIDKAFVVKGIGTVLLGIVKSGTVSVHDKLISSSSGTEVTIRSIQSNDVDIERAEANTRVGIAVKGIEADQVEKGDILSAKRVVPCREIVAKIDAIKINKEEILKGKAYTFVSNFSYTTAYVDSFEDDHISLKLDRPLAVQTGDNIMLARAAMPRIFCYGTILNAK